MKKVPMSIREFEVLKGQRCGVCPQCKTIIWGDMDEMAKDVYCETCRENLAVGMTQAFQNGLLMITETDFVFVK